MVEKEKQYTGERIGIDGTVDLNYQERIKHTAQVKGLREEKEKFIYIERKG